MLFAHLLSLLELLILFSLSSCAFPHRKRNRGFHRCVLLDESGAVKYEWKDPGICAVASFDVILCAL